MKTFKIFILFSLTALVLLGSLFDDLRIENLTYEIVDDEDGNPGGGIKLTWDNPYGTPASGFCGSSSDGWEFIIFVDDEPVDTVSDSSYIVYTPGSDVYVALFDGESVFRENDVDFEPVETACIEVWSVTDPDLDHPKCFGFSPSGSVGKYSTIFEDNWQYIDFFIGVDEDRKPYFMSPSEHVPDPFNEDINQTVMETVIYDSLHIASPIDKGYSTMTPIINNQIYSFWLDDDGAYDSTSHFGKIKVDALEGYGGDVYKVYLTLAYQPEPGLRWVVTE